MSVPPDAPRPIRRRERNLVERTQPDAQPSLDVKLAELSAEIARLRLELLRGKPAAGVSSKAEAEEEATEGVQARERGSHRFAMRSPATLSPTADRELPPPPARFALPGELAPATKAWIAAGCGIALFAIAYFSGFLLGDRAIRKEAEAARAALRSELIPPQLPRWNQHEIIELDAALVALQKGDGLNAVKSAEALAVANPQLPGIDFLRGCAAVAQGRFTAAEVHLNAEQSSASVFAARSSLQRARAFLAQNKTVEAAGCLLDSARRAPTSAGAFFWLAELNRRAGRVNDAQTLYTRALLRTRPGRSPDDALIGLRKCLGRVEGGREVEVRAEVEAALAQPAPRPEWFLAAAALALQANDARSASGWLERAAKNMRPERYIECLDDFIFRAHMGRSELKARFPSSEERARWILRAQPILLNP